MEEKDLHHHDHECDCEHEHHHDHDHEHHHDHDHEHHHDREHEHEHHHDHECGCGCEHDHEHEHHHDHGEECHDPNCTDPSHHHHHHKLVDIAHHESSIIGALKGTIPMADYEAAEKLLAEQMREAGRRVTEAGGIIGHIKFVLTGPGKCSQISVTDVEENIRRFDGTSCQLEGVAIVFAVEDELLEQILTETVGSILEKEE